MARRYKILVIAEAANPEWVSVPLVGWSMAYALRNVADVHIVTQIRNREAFLRAGLVEGVDFTSIDSESVARPAYALATAIRGGSQKGWTLVTALSSLVYPYFERLTWKRFGTALKAREYDIVHRITPLTPTTGSSLAMRCTRLGIPFVIGPLNGGLPWPSAFADARRQENEWLSRIRGAYKLLPGRNKTLQAAKVILAGSRYTAAEIPSRFEDKLIYMPENGIDLNRFAGPNIASAPEDARSAGDIRFCFIGRLVPYKGPDMAILAAAPLLREGRARLDLIGDGPLRDELKDLAVREGVADRVHFHGWVAHNQVQVIARESQIFLFPSVREFGGGAVLEAMALGLAPVVVDYGGPGELIEPDRGIAVPLGTREEIISSLRQEVDALARNPGKAAEMGRNAHRWATSMLTWQAKAEAMIDVYAWALGDVAEKPKPF
jgi:glycosyltransferase involved in cell wall biosynthesis